MPTHHRFPIIVFLGYANRPDDFDREIDDFESLLARVDIGGATGYEMETGASEREADAEPPSTSSAAPAPASEDPAQGVGAEAASPDGGG